MASFFTSVLQTAVAAIEGMLADNAGISVISRAAANAAIPQGRAVVFVAGDTDAQVRIPATTGQVSGPNLMGVSFFEDTAPANPYAVGDQVPVLRKGKVWVLVEEAVTPASSVFVRHAAGTGGTAAKPLGGFRASADSNTSATLVSIDVARYLTSASADGLALLAINLP